MLSQHSFQKTARATKQKGVVLIIAIVVLLAMTVAALALIRSVDTTTLIAGNLAFQQSATHSGDLGVEHAIAWMDSVSANTLENDKAVNGYSASGSLASKSPAAGQTWDAYWATTLQSRSVSLTQASEAASTPANPAGNDVSYVIDRMCDSPGSITSGISCSASPVVVVATGNVEEGGEPPMNATSIVYYRITVRIAGPRNTVSYIQAVVSR